MTVVPLDRVAAWMDGQELGSGPITDVRALAGGTQNIMLRTWRAMAYLWTSGR